jgi:hypothetical protein
MSLIVHCGGVEVPRSALAQVPTPDATDSWQPVGHAFLANALSAELKRADYEVVGEAHALAKEGARYFGFFQIKRTMITGLDYSAMVGLRNSHDRSLPVGLVAGSHVTVCDNLAFSGAINVFRKHTSKVLDEIEFRMFKATQKLKFMFDDQDRRYGTYLDTALEIRDADSLAVEILRADIVSPREFGTLVNQWHNPEHLEHTQGGLTVWRFFNAVTEALKSKTDSALVTIPKRTMALHKLLDNRVGYTEYTSVQEEFALAA